MTTTPDPEPILDLDLRGLKCPLPALRVRKALAGLAAGGVLRASATDPMAAIDIPHLLQDTGDVLLASEQNGESLLFTILKR